MGHQAKAVARGDQGGAKTRSGPNKPHTGDGIGDYGQARGDDEFVECAGGESVGFDASSGSELCMDAAGPNSKRLAAGRTESCGGFEVGRKLERELQIEKAGVDGAVAPGQARRPVLGDGGGLAAKGAGGGGKGNVGGKGVDESAACKTVLDVEVGSEWLSARVLGMAGMGPPFHVQVNADMTIEKG